MLCHDNIAVVAEHRMASIEPMGPAYAIAIIPIRGGIMSNVHRRFRGV